MTIAKMQEADSGKLDFLFSRRYTHERLVLRSSDHITNSHDIRLFDELLDGHLRIREGAPETIIKAPNVR